jgi:hypothetical protein
MMKEKEKNKNSNWLEGDNDNAFTVNDPSLFIWKTK